MCLRMCVLHSMRQCLSVIERECGREREQTRKRGSVCVNAYVSDRPH